MFEELWTELFWLPDNPYNSSLNILSEWANRDYNKIENCHMSTLPPCLSNGAWQIRGTAVEFIFSFYGMH